MEVFIQRLTSKTARHSCGSAFMNISSSECQNDLSSFCGCIIQLLCGLEWTICRFHVIWHKSFRSEVLLKKVHINTKGKRHMVASCFDVFGTILELGRDIIKNNVLSKFHDNDNVPSTLRQCFSVMLNHFQNL